MLSTDVQRLSVPNNLLLFVADAFLITLSLVFAVLLPSGAEAGTLLRIENVLKASLVVLTFTLVMQYCGLGNFSITKRRNELIVRHLQAMGVGCLVLALFYVLSPTSSLGAKTTSVSVVIIWVSAFGWRLIVSRTRVVKTRTERVLVLGTGAVGADVARHVAAAADLDMEIVGVLSEGEASDSGSPEHAGFLGNVSDVERLALIHGVHRIVVSLRERRGRMPLDELVRLKLAGVKVEDAHSAYERLTGRIRLEHLAPSWLFLSPGFRNGGIVLWFKYCVDSMIALALLLVSAPVLAVVAAAIWFETGRPVLFTQDRIGRNGRKFRMYKFRSMFHSPDAEAKWVADGDSRITRVGAIIRKYRLDEFPQLFNVLKGDMSLVGPRPEQPYFCEMLGRQVPYFPQRHSVRPGITGWAQVKYQYGASVAESSTKLEYDLFYLKHMSPLLDLWIMFSTVYVLIAGKGAK